MDFITASLENIFSSIDSVKQDGKINKDELKQAQTAYGGIFNITKGMTLETFAKANANVFEQHRAEQIDKYSKNVDELYSEGNYSKLRATIRSSGLYFGLRNINLSYDDLKPFLKTDGSDKSNNLKEAFEFLDKYDNWESKGEVNKATRQQDGELNTLNLEVDEPMDLLFFAKATGQNNLVDKNLINLIQQEGFNCSVQDVEKVLMAIAKFKEYYQDKSNNSI